MAQALHGDPDRRALHHRQRLPGRVPGPPAGARKGLVQVVPGGHLDPPVPLGIRGDAHLGFGMGGRVRALEPVPVPRRAPGLGRRSGEVEDPVRAHPPEYLRSAGGERVRDLCRRVAGVEHHQRRHRARSQAPGRVQVCQQSFSLREEHGRVITARCDPARIERIHPRTRAPRQAHQDADRPTGQQPVPARSAHLHHREAIDIPRVRTRQRAHIDPEHQRLTRPGRGQRPHQHPTQPVRIHPTRGQRVVHHRMPAPELRLQRQLHRGKNRPRRAQHRVTQLEQRITTPREAPVDPGPQRPQPRKPRPTPASNAIRLDHTPRTWQDKPHGHPTFFDS